MKEITAYLDKIADLLEENGCINLAYSIDKYANTMELVEGTVAGGLLGSYDVQNTDLLYQFETLQEVLKSLHKDIATKTENIRNLSKNNNYNEDKYRWFNRNFKARFESQFKANFKHMMDSLDNLDKNSQVVWKNVSNLGKGTDSTEAKPTIAQG